MQIRNIALMTSVYQGLNALDKNTCDKSPWFETEVYLGKRGFRYHSEPIRYTLAAARVMNVQQHDDNSAVFFASNTADKSVRKQIYKKLMSDSGNTISAAYAPNTSVNMAAGVFAQTYKLHGPSVTVTGPSDASCVAMTRASRFLERNPLHTAYVCEVEYLEEEPERSGAILWQLTKEVSNEDHSLNGCIEVLDWGRWTRNDIVELLCSFSTGKPIYLIGNCVEDTEWLCREMRRKEISISEFDDETIKSRLNSSLYLFGALSSFVLSRCRGLVLLLADTGQFFLMDVKQKGA